MQLLAMHIAVQSVVSPMGGQILNPPLPVASFKDIKLYSQIIVSDVFFCSYKFGAGIIF